MNIRRILFNYPLHPNPPTASTLLLKCTREQQQVVSSCAIPKLNSVCLSRISLLIQASLAEPSGMSHSSSGFSPVNHTNIICNLPAFRDSARSNSGNHHGSPKRQPPSVRTTSGASAPRASPRGNRMRRQQYSVSLSHTTHHESA